VVDAISGKPIAGVDVILRATLGVASFGDGGNFEVSQPPNR
jgi:hypothetical protein